MSLRRIRKFITDNAQWLAAQLLQLEQNIAQETKEIRRLFEVIPVPVFTKVGGGIYTTGQAVIADTSLAGFAINVEPPSDGRAGWIVVINKSANTLQVVPLAPATVDLATSVSWAGGMFLLFFDGANFWSK